MNAHAALTLTLPALSTEQMEKLFQDMQTHGYACVANFLSAASLSKMQDFVAGAVERSQNEYVAFRGAEAVAGSGLDTLAQCPDFQSIFAGLYRQSEGKPSPPVAFYQLLRCLTGKGMTEHSFNFHYDSYLVTALIPIVIPDHGRPGDLYVLANTRGVRRSYLANLVDKILLGNRVSQACLRWLADRRPRLFTRITMVPGNLYLFWGYRSIHANEPCDPGTVRATALYHFFDPHADSRMKQALRR